MISGTSFLAIVAAVGLGIIYPWLESWQFWSCFAAMAAVVLMEEIE